MRAMHWRQQGQEPDYRFSLANERTFLAWIRTALAVLAGGILLHQFATAIQPRVLVVAASVLLALVGAVLAGGAWFSWKGNEIAMRHGKPLPGNRLVPVLAAAVALLSAAAAVMLLQ